MNDLISRQAAIDTLDELCNRICEYSKKQRHTMCGACNLGSAFDVIDELPAAEPKRGKWKEEQDDDWAGGGAWVCSDCGWGYSFGGYHEANEFKHCPNCGARMGD